MNREIFFDEIKGSLFKTFSQAQVDGINALLDSMVRYNVTDIDHGSNIFSQVHHETGGYMLGIKETVYRSHKNKNPSDATVIARLNNAYAKGQLPWVKTPYWREGWFGRGPIQTTHKHNYEKMGKRLGVDLLKDPNRILEPRIGADSAVVGMVEGLYTGKKLSDYKFPDCLRVEGKNNSKWWKLHPRRIVNGKDGTDSEITANHNLFKKAFSAAGGLQLLRSGEKPRLVLEPEIDEPVEDLQVTIDPTHGGIPNDGPEYKKPSDAVKDTTTGGVIAATGTTAAATGHWWIAVIIGLAFVTFVLWKSGLLSKIINKVKGS